jgi:hypothetical protein
MLFRLLIVPVYGMGVRQRKGEIKKAPERGFQKGFAIMLIYETYIFY